MMNDRFQSCGSERAIAIKSLSSIRIKFLLPERDLPLGSIPYIDRNTEVL